MTDILCAVTLRDETFSELLDPAQELDVSSLKEDADAKPSQEEQEEDAEANARLAEVATIQEFLAAKKARIAANPHLELEKPPVAKKKAKVGGKGRPRKSFDKVVTFTVVGTNKFKLAGRGRPGTAKRTKFTLHHTHVPSLDRTKVYTRAAITKMQSAKTK
jgi:DNA-binding protein H-NS